MHRRWHVFARVYPGNDRRSNDSRPRLNASHQLRDSCRFASTNRSPDDSLPSSSSSSSSLATFTVVHHRDRGRILSLSLSSLKKQRRDRYRFNQRRSYEAVIALHRDTRLAPDDRGGGKGARLVPRFFSLFSTEEEVDK